MNDLIFIALFCTSGLINLSSFDDALIDLLALGITRSSLARRRAPSAEVPTVGVFVANWIDPDGDLRQLDALVLAVEAIEAAAADWSDMAAA